MTIYAKAVEAGVRASNADQVASGNPYDDHAARHFEKHQEWERGFAAGWKLQTIKNDAGDAAMTPVEYVVRVKHDRGRVAITTWATSARKAWKLVRISEGCPDSAIISIRRRFPHYGHKRDYPKIELHRNGEYVGTTTWARTCKEAVARYADANPGAAPVRANFKR